MLKLGRRPIPDLIKEAGRTRELLGEIKQGTMQDCIYNALIAGDDIREFVNEPQTIEKTIEQVNLLHLPVAVKDYQLEDLCKSLVQDEVFNINKPGYGKTLETIIWLRVRFGLLSKGSLGQFRVLILCPKTVIGTWEAQLNKYWPGWDELGDWEITNYEQILNKQRLANLQKVTWDAIILDESHKIKSMKSKTNAAVNTLKSHCRHCLTGTPIKNRPQDLAAQLKWLSPYSITNFTDFQFAFCEMERDRWGWQARGLTKNKVMVENLQNLLQLYCVGGQEHNIGIAPEYIKVKLKLDPKVKKLYKKVEGEWDEELQKKVIDTVGLMKEGIKVQSAIEAACRRQQLASNPQLFDIQLKNVKFEWILDWLEGTDEKVVIFSKYAKTIDALEKFLKDNKQECFRVQREQKPAIRQLTIEKWKKSKAQVLLGTYGVLSEGVDGLQEACRYIIFVDREWTASANEQAEKRIARTGQKYQPIIYILQATGTIDVNIERIQLDKGHDAAELLEPVSE